VIAANGTGPAGLDVAEEMTSKTSDFDSEETTADKTSRKLRRHASLTSLTQGKNNNHFYKFLQFHLSATYASCSIIRQTGINMVKQGGSLTWMDNVDTAASIMNVINPDNIQNVIYQDFKAEENPLTHELISEAGVIAAPAQVQPQVINQTIMPGQFMPMFQSPFTQNMQMQQQQPVLVQQVVTNQQQMVQPQMVQQQMVQQQMVQPQMVQQEMVQSQMFQQPMVHQQAPAPVAVEETSPNTSPFGSPFDFLFNKN